MVSITTRTAKGAPLTFAEMDANFTALKAAIEALQAGGGTTSAPTPTLTISGPLTYATNAAAGTLVASIGNVPSGVTPTITPNDGRLVVAGSTGAWTIRTGMTASSAGTIALAATAAGATGTSVNVTVTAVAPPTPPPSATAKTTFPTSGAILYEMDPASAGVADGARAKSVPDATRSITATAPGAGPVFIANAANGKAGLRFAGTDDRLTIGEPTAVASALSQSTGWSFIITFKDAQGPGAINYRAMFCDDYRTGFFVAAGADNVARDNASRSYDVSDPAANVHTLVYSAEGVGVRGRAYLDGSLFTAGETMTHGAGKPFTIGALMIDGAPFDSFVGTILNFRIVNTAWSPAEALQAHFWACARYGKPLPIAGRSYFPVMDGDSITFGIGTNGDGSYPAQLARLRGWALGGYANVGKPGAIIEPGGDPNNLTDWAARDVDGFAEVTGLPVVLISGEWFNQGFAGGTTQSGQDTANKNRAYALLRKNAGKVSKHLMWTSTSADREGGGRDSFNASLVADHPNIDVVVPVHTDPTIGVNGRYTDRTYFADNAHLTTAGYAVLARLIDAALTNAGLN